VKRLFAGVEDAFHQEVKALEVFRNLNHPHLIKLLGTYHYDGEYYLIFPWADGDLRAFWSRNPGPHSIPTASRWVLKQCLGIAEGLRTIHCGQRLYGGSIPVKGRHGDIKPENILHFAHSQGCDGQQWGVLTISDFGLARLHREHSERRVYPHRPPGSLTYRAPEGDFNEPVSTLSDLWPLGCLFLEFVVWLLQGWNEVDNFSKERLKEDNSSHRLLALEDKFFNRGEEFGAYTKPSVLKVSFASAGRQAELTTVAARPSPPRPSRMYRSNTRPPGSHFGQDDPSSHNQASSLRRNRYRYSRYGNKMQT
jgi:serine/threonine protein kinase